MSWRDELRPATFRGVHFEALELDGEEGRRVVVDDCPETDDLAPAEDLGRVRPSFSLNGFVTGDDYLDRRDALRVALNKFGPGELVTPWRGRILVQVGRVRWSHDVSGGYCSVTFECVEYGGEARPLVSEVAPSTVSESSAVVEVVAAQPTGFADLPAAYGTQVTLGVALFTLTYRDTMAAVAIALANDDVVKDPFDADGLQVGLFVAAFALIDDVRVLLQMVTEWPLGAPRYSLVTTSTPTATESSASSCLDLTYQTIRVLALARACDIAVATDYASADAAEAAMAELAEAIGVETEDPSTTGDLFAALIDLRAALVEALVSVADRLPRLRVVTVPSPAPAIVLAFDLYDPAEFEARAAEIVSLNNTLHPGFVVGPTTVLTAAE